MKKHNDICIVFTGGMNIDIVAQGITTFAGPGEQVWCTNWSIAPGGKARNMAAMTALYTGPGKTAFIGKTTKDNWGLWEIPLKDLQEKGVDTDYVICKEPVGNEQPTSALILVNKQGENQIYYTPGIGGTFSPDDFSTSTSLLDAVAENQGLLALCLEMPLFTAIHAIKEAGSRGLRVFFDPGGLPGEFQRNHEKLKEYSQIIGPEIYMIKPNEHEAFMLTGKKVHDFISAGRAAEVFLNKGIKHVVITHGSKGAYYFTEESSRHFPAPEITDYVNCDETGCGDQMMAVLCGEFSMGTQPEKAVRKAVAAGTLQYTKQGICPLNRNEIEAFFSSL